MILSDTTIKRYIDMGFIGVDPEPTENQIQPASLDVRFGDELYDFSTDTRRTSRRHVIEPGVRYLAHTKERIQLPNTTAAQLAGRSSIGRKGLIIHKTAGWIDPGFRGEITLEVFNLGTEPVEIETGERIGQLVFFSLDQPSTGYDGHYQDQSGATQHYVSKTPNRSSD